MIKIAGKVMDSDTILNGYMSNSIEYKIAKILYSSNEIYNYNSLNQLNFELKLRKNIINAAKELYKSRFSFRVFRKSKCNEDFWERTKNGGFALKAGVKPSDAIKDIYIHSSKYGTECSTAIVIIYYKALADILPEELFNKMFPNIYLMNWQHLDDDLGVTNYIRVADYLPGDCRYFKNPDVDPINPEWQGENVILLDNGLYYGHGLGIGTSEKFIDALNKERIKDSNTSAYLMDTAKRPDFKHLSDMYYSSVPRLINDIIFNSINI